jgi:SAM-dependent methyltransferase
MHARGWQVLGVDAAESVVRRIEQELGLPALAGDLAAPDLAASSFDVITMRQSLEHVHRPLETLRRAFRLLAGDGKLMVWVPNIDSLAFRWFGPAWYGLDLPRHLTHFTPSTLRRMVAEAGFQGARTWMVPHASWLRRSAARAREQGDKSHKSWWLARRPAARWATWYAAAAGRSDCIGLSATRPGD